MKRNKLSPVHKRKRLDLAERRLNDFKDLIFVDEKKFQVNSSSKTEYVTRKDGNLNFFHIDLNC